MKIIKNRALAVFILLLAGSISFAQNGGGDLKLGYIYIDDEGNRSVSHSSFNYYDGPAISLENFHYRFKNGFRIKSNLENINLDNRNLSFELGKTGRFGIDINTDRYRRVYDFDGDSRTKRDLTSAGIWFNPSRYVKVFADGSFNSTSGKIRDSFEPGFNAITRELDYNSRKYGVGARIKYKGRMFHAEYNTISYSDEIDGLKDQSRMRYRLMAHFPVPDYEWLVLSGVLQKFKTEFDDTGFELKSTTARGSVLARLPQNFMLNYIAFYNRAGSDSDFVETDNIAHLIYAGYTRPATFGITAGYQMDINDDFEDEIKANSYYFSGWLKPYEVFELKTEYGFRAEEVEDGFRLVGNEDRSRIRAYWTYRKSELGSFKVGFENKMRKNEQLDSEADFDRYHFDLSLDNIEMFMFSGGYSYSRGDYDNNDTEFEFTSQQVYLNVDSKVYRGFVAGFGLTYFRSKLDLDDESINMIFRGSYRFRGGNRAELVYRVFNFDDFLLLDNYYTENIIEFNLIKSLSF
ncbi:MAG: hypothetical protein JSU85_13240 [Candidatus Zixiibacteriota bacterium]|nr:MAG: hypothetical protein JSU85_13240 [candidate division Zixibacteria bacterium]